MNSEENIGLAIKKLECSYDQSTVVLKGDDLAFENGKMYFLLGKSGSGKSTFLEAVGLMNKTAKNHSSVVCNGVDILELWNSDRSSISKFRSSNFAFIFQSTNLMPGYSAGENMCFGAMVDGKSITEVKPKVLSAMDNIELDRSIFDKNIAHLSGGQRQRLAFVRAVTADYKVLFGDEPTGNLDKLISKKLMDYLSGEIKDKNKVAIIVSHNVAQAKKYADVIMCLKKGDNEDEAAELNPTTSFKKVEGLWYKVADNSKVLNIEDAIISLLNGDDV